MRTATITIDGARWTFQQQASGQWATTVDRDADAALAYFTSGERRPGTLRAEAILATLNAGLAGTHNLTRLNRGLLAELKAGATFRSSNDRHINDKAVAFACSHLDDTKLHRRLANSYLRDMPEPFWWNLARSKSTEARKAAAWSVDEPFRTAIRHHLVNDPASEVRHTIAQRTTDPALHAALAHDTDRNVLSAVAALATDPDTIRAAVRHADHPTVLHDAAQNPNLPGDLIAELCNDTATSNDVTASRTLEAASTAAAHPNCSNETLSRLIEPDRHFKIRAAVATNPSTPDDLLVRLARDPSSSVRKTLLQRSLPRQAFDLCAAKHPDEAARSPHTPTDWLHDAATAGSTAATLNLLNHHPLTSTERDGLLANPASAYAATSNDLDRLLNSEPHTGMLIAAAARKPTYAETLVHSTIPAVRAAAASNRGLPPEVVDALMHDPDATVRAATTRTHERVAVQAADDPDPLVRIEAVRHTRWHADIIERLADDPEADVRLAALEAVPLSDTHRFRLFANDDDLRVQCLLAERIAIV